MKKIHLLSTVAASFLITAGGAVAQNTQQQMPQRAPAAQQNAPAEKMGPSSQPGEQSGKQTTGESSKRLNTSEPKAETSGPKANEKSAGSTSGRTSNEKSAGSEREKAGGQHETTGQGTKSTETEKNKINSQGRSSASEQERNGVREQSRSRVESNETIGQGAAGGVARLSPQQRTRITTIFREHREARPVQLNIPVRVGVRVPGNVHFYPVPPQVVEVYPEWRGYDYILVSEQILIIDPNTHEIVAVLQV